jgi:hypothetical protein
MTQRKVSVIQEVLASAQSQRDKSKLSQEGLLIDSLQRAVSSLSLNFNYNDPFGPKGSDSADYYKMFESVAENFAQLGKELLTMRSSYLPYQMIEDSLKDMERGLGASSKKISEIIDADTTLESYENVFFRLLGMPSTADIRDKALTTVTQNGDKLYRDKDAGFYLTNKVLEARAKAPGDRLSHPSSATYDFLSGAVPSMDRLTAIKFTKIEELSKILGLIKDLGREERRDENSLELANALHSLMNANRGVASKDARHHMQEVDQLRVIFGPEPPAQPSPTFLLARMLDISLLWLHPKLAPVINLSMRKHLWNEHVQGKTDVTMKNLHEDSNFWQYSYLLFPPVQDERIATCISEPSKMCAEPFLPESMRTVNGKKLKSTLLEAVMRIRLDLVTGFPQKAARVSSTGMSIATEGDERAITPDEMGLLESLLIIRLFSALHGFAKDAAKKIEAAHAAQHQSKQSPSAEPAGTSDHTPTPTSKKKKSTKQKELEALLLVEDSLMLLFGKGSVPEALSYQEGVSRNAGVRGAHLMGAALSVLDVPKRWAEKKLGEIKEIEHRVAEKLDGPATGSLRAKLGVAKGVGAVDLLAYLIALFTAKEEVLLALLNDRQFKNLKEEYPTGFFNNFDRQSIDTGAAVCEIADRAYDAYQLFRFMLSPDAPRASRPTAITINETAVPGGNTMMA